MLLLYNLWVQKNTFWAPWDAQLLPRGLWRSPRMHSCRRPSALQGLANFLLSFRGDPEGPRTMNYLEMRPVTARRRLIKALKEDHGQRGKRSRTNAGRLFGITTPRRISATFQPCSSTLRPARRCCWRRSSSALVMPPLDLLQQQRLAGRRVLLQGWKVADIRLGVVMPKSLPAFVLKRFPRCP